MASAATTNWPAVDGDGLRGPRHQANGAILSRGPAPPAYAPMTLPTVDDRPLESGVLADVLLFGLLSLAVHFALYLHWQHPVPAGQPARPAIVDLSLVAPPPPMIEAPPLPAARPALPPAVAAPPKPRPAPLPGPRRPAPKAEPAPPLPPAEAVAPAPAPVASPGVAPSSTLAPAAPEAVAELQPAHTRATSRNNPKPHYPALARRRGWEGKVRLRIHVLASGLPDRVEVEASSDRALFDESALRAVKQWTFTPARRGDVPEASTLTLSIVFKLDN